MKKMITICTFLLMIIIGNVQAQKRALSELPREVSQSFNHKYKQVQVQDWKLEEDYYTISFTKEGTQYETAFNLAGVWSRTDKRIKMDGLPSPVVASCKKGEYNKFKVNEVKEVTFAGFEDKPLYSLEVADNSQEYELYYDKEGTLVMKVFNTQLNSQDVVADNSKRGNRRK